MVSRTTQLGGTASDVTVGKIGHGLMLMTWKEVPTPDEECFEAIMAGIDSLPAGVKMVLNSGEFYGHNLSTANLDMLARFFTKYPDYADKTFLSVKGGLKPQSFEPDASLDNLRRSVDAINAALKGTKQLDLFEMARVDRKITVEEAVKNMIVLIKEGKFSHIGMSECRAETLRRANSVHPITAVEIEVSPWAYEEEQKKVIAAAQELNITVAAYSPLGRGFLTGQIKSLDDIPEGDMRRHFGRFQPHNFEHNLALVKDLSAVAERKKVSPAQLCIAWVAQLAPQMISIPGSSHKKRTLENLSAVQVDLSEQEMEEIGKILASHEIKGKRYQDVPDEVLNLWG
ncbi:aldo/keto reductase [Neolentinus lepideus HHB14362 ss-1]|uniref:Aldo/keto reductase n=1 Tax=Neolentinus lepideus HHB14362 ss-1 TaxID=1314782 RepID=A0A165T8R3_9AGAM|nr:aldo/keto reductase [Neolentinus lepideus HHB14362 ss-1]